MEKVHKLNLPKVHYLVTHPLIGSNVRFDSWTILCERALEIAEVEASDRLQPKFKALALSIADEIVEQAEEIADEA